MEENAYAPEMKNFRGKTLPKKKSKVLTKKELIVKYRLNNPKMRAFEIAGKVHTTDSYVWKVLSEHRDRGKVERGGWGRIFGHGKVWYEWWVPRGWLDVLDAPVVNARTGMRQVGFKARACMQGAPGGRAE